jgi:hypothetical protein
MATQQKQSIGSGYIKKLQKMKLPCWKNAVKFVKMFRLIGFRGIQMNKALNYLILATLLGTTVNQVGAQDTTTKTTTTKAHTSVLKKMENGVKSLGKDTERGVKDVAKGTETVAKDTEKGVAKVGSKTKNVVEHKKTVKTKPAAKGAPATTTTTDTTTTTAQ